MLCISTAFSPVKDITSLPELRKYSQKIAIIGNEHHFIHKKLNITILIFVFGTFHEIQSLDM